MRITADTDRCIGAGQCVLTAADLFDQDEDGIVALLTDSVDSAADVELARQAEHLCPAAALRITVTEEVGAADTTEGTRGA
ncbi:ferredoxin [Streptomyces sp. NPDC091287]|uniref:ferredoxin n=1 Tax=Streptomyces sp. NPDC091287 TaxID=3365988 RepID=UPI0037F6A66F